MGTSYSSPSEKMPGGWPFPRKWVSSEQRISGLPGCSRLLRHKGPSRGARSSASRSATPAYAKRWLSRKSRGGSTVRLAQSASSFRLTKLADASAHGNSQGAATQAANCKRSPIRRCYRQIPRKGDCHKRRYRCYRYRLAGGYFRQRLDLLLLVHTQHAGATLLLLSFLKLSSIAIWVAIVRKWPRGFGRAFSTLRYTSRQSHLF
jgi:hypothetical protein